jgi:hypothetical protein
MILGKIKYVTLSSFSKSCLIRHLRRSANGQELVGHRQQLIAQLQGIKEFAGNWTINCLDLIVANEENKCTVRYILSSEKAGQFEVIAIITAQNNRIESIHEVYYQISVNNDI